MGAVILNVFDIILFLLNSGLRIALTSLWVKTDEGVEQVLIITIRFPNAPEESSGNSKRGRYESKDLVGCFVSGLLPSMGVSGVIAGKD